MNKFKKIIKLFVAAVFATVAMQSCQDADAEFVHDNNLLSDVRIKMTTGAEGVRGKIIEYNASGEVVPTEAVTVKSVEGGYGVVLFELSPALRGAYNPERCYLGASLTYDEVIEPGLAGIKDITNRNAEGIAQGIQVTVRSGIGTRRPYTIIGYFEGEYQITPEPEEE